MIWTQKLSKTTVEFRETNQTVSVTGMESSVRQILSSAGSFLESVPEGYVGPETSSRVQSGASCAGSKASKAPSKVFERMATTKASSISALSISNKKSPTRDVKKVPYKRIVVQESEKENGLLSLLVNQRVTVEQDPDAADDHLDRWVFGKIHETGETGWFSLANTRDLVE